MATKKQLPKRLYVTRQMGSDDSYLAVASAAELATVGGSTVTGVYMLVELGHIEAPPAFVEGKHKP